MKKFYKLNQQLEKLESQKQNYNSFENISIMQFIKYKNIISKKNKIAKQMQKIVSLGEEINSWYDTKNNSWIENLKISCTKYCKLEQKICYKKNLKLYKLGLLDKKPMYPLFQNISEKLQPILPHLKNILNKINFPKKIFTKLNYFSSNILPQKMNNLAIESLKHCIKGYKMVQGDIKYVKNCFKSQNLYKHFKQLADEANRQLSTNENSISFKDSLKVNPNQFINHNSTIGVNNPIKIPNNIYNNINYLF